MFLAEYPVLLPESAMLVPESAMLVPESAMLVPESGVILSQMRRMLGDPAVVCAGFGPVRFVEAFPARRWRERLLDHWNSCCHNFVQFGFSNPLGLASCRAKLHELPGGTNQANSLRFRVAAFVLVLTASPQGRPNGFDQRL